MSELAGRVRGSLGAKLLLAQMLVVIAGSLTLAVVALAVAPGAFHTPVRMALGAVPPRTTRHLGEGLAKAITVALATGTGVAVATALGVSFLLARRSTSPIRSLAEAAGQVARGRYTARVPMPAGGDELARLAAAFSTMAETLEASEQRRTELLADLAHELRTPLATIDGYLEGVRRRRSLIAATSLIGPLEAPGAGVPTMPRRRRPRPHRLQCRPAPLAGPPQRTVR